MAIVSTGLTAAGLKSEFFDRLGSTETVWQDLATTINSNRDKETYAFLGSVPPMRKWGTGRLARGMFTESYDVKNEKYESTIEVDRDELSDDMTGQIRIRVNEMASKAAVHKDSLIADLLVNGNQAGFKSYDGSIFFSNAHVLGEQAAQDNTLSPPAVDASNPTVAECKAAMKSAIQRLMTFVDDQGEPSNFGATGLVAVVPPSMYLTMLEAINATIIDNTSNVLTGAARVLAFSRLTDAKTWYLQKTDVPVRAFVLQDREPIEFKAREEDSDEGFMREVFKYGVRARYAMAYGYWQHSLRSEFA